MLFFFNKKKKVEKRKIDAIPRVQINVNGLLEEKKNQGCNIRKLPIFTWIVKFIVYV